MDSHLLTIQPVPRRKVGFQKEVGSKIRSLALLDLFSYEARFCWSICWRYTLIIMVSAVAGGPSAYLVALHEPCSRRCSSKPRGSGHRTESGPGRNRPRSLERAVDSPSVPGPVAGKPAPPATSMMCIIYV